MKADLKKLIEATRFAKKIFNRLYLEEIRGEGLRITACDGGIQVTVTCPGEDVGTSIPGDKPLVVDAADLALASKLKPVGDTMGISRDGLSLGGDSLVKWRGSGDPADYPHLAEQVNPQLIGVYALHDLVRHMGHLATFTLKSGTRLGLNGVCIRPQSLAASDANRLLHIPLEGDIKEQRGIVIPSSAASLIGSIPKGIRGDEKVAAFYDDRTVVFKSPSLRIAACTIDARFPDYGALLCDRSAPHIAKIRVSKEVVKTLRSHAALPAASSREGAITMLRLDGNESILEVVTEAKDGQTLRSTIDAIDAGGGSLDKRFRTKYLMDAFEVLEGEQVELRASGGKPESVHFVGGDGTEAIVMPLRAKQGAKRKETVSHAG